jgi:hypothetical protein
MSVTLIDYVYLIYKEIVMFGEKDYLQYIPLDQIESAAKEGEFFKMAGLIQECTEINPEHYKWWTALELAAQNKHVRCFEYLIQTCKSFPDEYQKFALRMQRENGISQEALEEVAEVSVEVNQASASPLIFSNSLSLPEEKAAEEKSEVVQRMRPSLI